MSQGNENELLRQRVALLEAELDKRGQSLAQVLDRLRQLEPLPKKLLQVQTELADCRVQNATLLKENERLRRHAHQREVQERRAELDQLRENSPPTNKKPQPVSDTAARMDFPSTSAQGGDEVERLMAQMQDAVRLDQRRGKQQPTASNDRLVSSSCSDTDDEDNDEMVNSVLTRLQEELRLEAREEERRQRSANGTTKVVPLAKEKENETKGDGNDDDDDDFDARWQQLRKAK